MVLNKPGGPLHFLYGKLSADEKTKLDAALAEAKKLKRHEAKSKIAAFVATLSDPLKAEAKTQREKYEKNKTESESKIKGLSAGAQNVYNEIKKVADDGSLTLEDEYNKTKQLITLAPNAVRDELKANNITLPGIPVFY
uniref:DUF148 domain-containing protein n=1 Tax=Bursaphelenchus xylophilus TaxID=6326 RepID=A0A1I7SF26_BURXY